MTLLIGIIMTAVIAFGAWRGSRRGAWAILWRWLPLLSLIALRAGLLQAGWIHPASWMSRLLLAAALAVLAVMIFRRRRSRAIAPAMIGNTTNVSPGRERLNQITGGILGAGYAGFLCLAAATLGSTLIFGVSMSSQTPDPGKKALSSPPAWLNPAKRVCNTMADLSSEKLLCYIPRVGEFSREMQALVKVLNATPEEQKRIVKKRRLREYIELPEVKEALNDPEYRALLKKMRYGNLAALKTLAGHDRTKQLFSCEKIRQFAEAVKPSDLLADMTPAPEPLAANAD